MGEMTDSLIKEESTMIIIACVDERNGLMFNHRRQSRDLAVCRDILQECSGKRLYMSAYSGKLFEETKEDRENIRDKEGAEDKESAENREGKKNPGMAAEAVCAEIRILENILQQAGEADACFIEDTDITGFEEQIQKVILYKWNRKYPADRYFTLDLEDESWELLQTGELHGSSHEKITKEIYEKRI